MQSLVPSPLYPGERARSVSESLERSTPKVARASLNVQLADDIAGREVVCAEVVNESVDTGQLAPTWYGVERRTG
jgi:hypothetical protein